MRLSDIFTGSDAKSVMPLIKNTTVVSVHEVATTAEVAKKIEEIKKTVSKPTSGTYLVIVFK
jgi:dihydropteroate synthase